MWFVVKVVKFLQIQTNYVLKKAVMDKISAIFLKEQIREQNPFLRLINLRKEGSSTINHWQAKTYR